MFFKKSKLRKAAIKVGVTSLASILILQPAYSQGSENIEALLKSIDDNTYNTLKAVNNLPDYLSSLTALALGWLSPDNSDTTADLQANFTTLTNNSIQNESTQAGIQTQLLKDFFGGKVDAKTVPYVNDLTYQTLIGFPYISPDPRSSNTKSIDPGLNYIENASGLMISHPIPNTSWRGNDYDFNKYNNYYKTINAVQTFNAYSLSQAYANYKNGQKWNQTQLSLIQQASNSNWFSQVASENIGIVLRQILMYNSQMFVLMTQLLQNQQQLLTAQTMTNTLLILSNQSNEEILLKRAQGSMPNV